MTARGLKALPNTLRRLLIIIRVAGTVVALDRASGQGFEITIRAVT
jgi:hypothetical protein